METQSEGISRDVGGTTLAGATVRVTLEPIHDPGAVNLGDARRTSRLAHAPRDGNSHIRLVF